MGGIGGYYEPDRESYCRDIRREQTSNIKREDICMRCEHGKGYFVGGNILYIGKDGSVSVESNGEIIDFPAKTIKFCPWCGKKLDK